MNETLARHESARWAAGFLKEQESQTHKLWHQLATWCPHIDKSPLKDHTGEGYTHVCETCRGLLKETPRECNR